MPKKKDRYTKYAGRTPFTRRLLKAMLEALDVELPVSRFYDPEPIYLDRLPPELFAKEIPVAWFEQRLRTNAQRINRGFWALNRTLLKRHGLRIISYRRGRTWYRRFIPTKEGLSWFEEYLRELPEEEAQRLAETLFRTIEEWETAALRQAEAMVEQQQETADIQAHLAQLLPLKNIVIERIDLARREVKFRKGTKKKARDPSANDTVSS